MDKMDNNDTITIKLEGDLVEDNVTKFKDTYMDYLKENIKKFIIDFKDVNYLSSMGIASILFLHKKIIDRKGEIELVNLNEKLKKFFIVLELPKGFIIK